MLLSYKLTAVSGSTPFPLLLDDEDGGEAPPRSLLVVEYSRHGFCVVALAAEGGLGIY